MIRMHANDRRAETQLWTETQDGTDRVAVTGLLGPVDLPTNGMMRIWWSVNGVKKLWVLSSYMVTNNESKPKWRG